MNEQQKAMLDQQLKLKRGAAIIEGTQEKFRQDGYSNLLNKYGTAQDSSTSYQYNQEIITNDMELIRLYEGNGLFTKIIDRPSEEAVKHGFDIDFGDEDVNEYVDDRMDDLDFEAKFATAEKWARLYGGSIIVILVDDGRGLEEPLDWANVRTIEELRVFERAIVQPDYTSMYNFHFLDTLDSDRPFAEPEYYQVFSIYGYFIVHRSRCLVFRNGRLPEQTTNATYRYWGIPEYVKIKRALRECITSHENGTKLLERCVQAIYKMKNLANLLSTEDGEDKVLQRLQVIDMARSILNSIAIDSDGEDYDFKTFSMSGVKDVLDSTCNMLSAVTEIPQTILFGRSPAGMNATGENDMENYYNMVENIQKQNMKKNSRTVIDLILKQGLLEDKIPEVPKYKVKFAALWSMSESEQASVDKTKADTEYVKAQTAQVYMDSNVLDPSEVRKSLASEGDFDIEDVLSDEDLNLPDDTFEILPEGKQETSLAAIKEPVEILDQSEDEAGTDIINVDLPDDQLMVNDKVFVNDIEEYADRSSINEIVINMDGGPGSGDWGHSGRPGKIGGSGGGGGSKHRRGTKEEGYTSEAKERKKQKAASRSTVTGTKKFGNVDEAEKFFGKHPDRALRRENREEYDRQMENYEKTPFKQWRNGLENNEEKAIQNYAGPDFSGINGLLRRQMTEKMVNDWNSTSNMTMQDMIKNIETGIDKFDLPEAITVYRTCEMDVFESLQRKVGSTFRDNAFTSTTVLDQTVASGNVRMIINVPAGKGKGAYIAPLGQPDEYEFLLQRGTEFTVRSCEQSNGSYVVKLDVTGNTRSSYSYATKEEVIEQWKRKGIYEESDAKRI